MYYGFNHTAGMGVTDSHGNRIGTVQTFATKTERDKWADDRRNEAIDAGTARTEMIRTIRYAMRGGMFNDYAHGYRVPEELRYLPMSHIAELYAECDI